MPQSATEWSTLHKERTSGNLDQPDWERMLQYHIAHGIAPADIVDPAPALTALIAGFVVINRPLIHPSLKFCSNLVSEIHARLLPLPNT